MARAQTDIDPERVEGWLRAKVGAIQVVITSVSGSAPRGPGAAMVVSKSDHTGTIGGGALEWALIATARDMLASGASFEEVEQPLGPEIGQCCGGYVRAALSRITSADVARMRQPTSPPTVYIFGAGHVGAALTYALAPLPLSVVTVDQRAALLSPLATLGQTVESALPEAVVGDASAGSAFVITTHDHALDFLITEAAIERGDAAYVGMIGSASKRAVLARRLAGAGLSDATLTCPIGAGVSADKRPEIIAAATAAEIVGVLF